MRTYDPDSKYDQEEIERIKPEPWMLEQMKLNPEYVHWGPGEDYMSESFPVGMTREERREKGMESGWNSSMSYVDWSEHTLQPDELNEVVHFYFSINRASEKCPDCRNGYSRAAEKIERDLISGGAYNGHISETHLRFLYDSDRLHVGPKLQKQIDALRKKDRTRDPFVVPIGILREACTGPLAIDSLRLAALVRFDCERAKVPSECATCQGHSYLYMEEPAKLQLTYWMLHPRKGAARGVEVLDIKKADLQAVYNFLGTAARRNFERFAAVQALSSTG